MGIEVGARGALQVVAAAPVLEAEVGAAAADGGVHQGAAAQGPAAAFALRFITGPTPLLASPESPERRTGKVAGMCSAVQFPCFIGLLTRWAPVSEIGTFLGLGTIGMPVGSFLVMVVSGYF